MKMTQGSDSRTSCCKYLDRKARTDDHTVVSEVPDDVRGVSWSEVATVPKRKSHRGLDLNFSLNTEENIWKGWKESGGTK